MSVEALHYSGDSDNTATNGDLNVLIALTCLDVCYQIKTRRPSATVVPLGYGCSPRLRLFQFVTTHNLLTQLCPHTTCPHNLLTHNLSPHNLSTHNLLTHNLHTHNLSPHNLLAQTHLAHTQLVTTQLVTTQLAHTQLAHTQLVTTQLTHGRRGTYGTGLSGGALGSRLAPWTPPLFAWQAWHSATSTVTLRGRRGTWRHRSSLCVAGVALMALGWLWWHLVPVWRRRRRRCLRSRRGTWRHRSALCLAGVPLMALGWLCWRAWFPFGAVDAAAVCTAGVALGDIDRHFPWQAWHLTTLWSLCVLGWLWWRAWFPFGARCLCGRRGTWRHRPSLGDIDRLFAWQAWHLWHWAGSGGALGSGSQLAPWSPRLFAWQAWHSATWTCILRGRHGAWWHPAPLCAAGVALTAPDAQPCHAALSHTIFVTHNSFARNFFTHISLTHTHSFVTHNFVTHNLSHTSLSHATSLSHTSLSHTQLCHTHTQLCHTHNSFTHNFVTDNFVTHTTLSHTTLSHTTLCSFVTDNLSHTALSHTALSHTTMSHTQSFTHSFVTNNFVIHNSFRRNFVTDNLSHTTLSLTAHNLSRTTLSLTTFHTQLFHTHTHNFLTNNSSPTTFEMIDPPPYPLSFLLSPCRFNHFFWLLEELDLRGFPVL